MELNIGLALTLTALGMGTVMIVLYAINLMIRGLGKLFGEKKLPAAPLVVTSAVAASADASVVGDAGGKQDEIVAAITAAVAAFMSGDSASAIFVKPYSTSFAWSSASKIENTQNR